MSRIPTPTCRILVCMCSWWSKRFSRGGSSQVPFLLAEQRRGWSLMIFLCSRNARPQKDEEGVARYPPCSQDAHGETVLVRCAQSRAALATPLNRVEAWRIGKPHSMAQRGTQIG